MCANKNNCARTGGKLSVHHLLNLKQSNLETVSLRGVAGSVKTLFISTILSYSKDTYQQYFKEDISNLAFQKGQQRPVSRVNT